MAFCSKCGAQLDDAARFCPTCGAAVGAAAEAAAGSHTSNNQSSNNQSFTEKFNTPDTTADFDAKDIEDNKVMGVLAYLGILVLVPIFAAKESKFARYHSNQGLILLLVAIGFGIAYSILAAILSAIWWRLFFLTHLIGSLGSIALTVWAVLGIVNVVNGKCKELPFIGKYRLLK